MAALKQNKLKDLVPRGLRPSSMNKEWAMSKDPNLPLTPKQKAFALYRGRGEGVYAAMEKAGYTAIRSGYALQAQPNIAKVIALERAKFERDNSMNRQKVMNGFLEAIDMAKLMSEPASMVAGWREIAKMCGYYEPVKVDMTLNGTVDMKKLTALSDTELLEQIKAGANATAQLLLEQEEKAK